MLEPIMKGLIEWIYGLIEDMADYVFGDIIDVLTMDMSYFKKAAPIVNDIAEIMLALGWALLLGNLVFQLLKSIMSGAGFEGEDPKILFMRTFAFSFLLLASPQICEMCSKMTGTVVAYLNIPRSFAFSAPTGLLFSGAGGVAWLIAIIVSIILIVQLVKLFFDIGERYVITCVLTFMAPLAFAMGGSKNTNDIFKGWCRMYGSMNIMLIMNIVFLKLITNAMANMWASNVIVWLVFVMALTRVARKIDAHISKIGLNPAQTSNSVGVRFPGGTTLVVVKALASLFGKSAANMKGGSGGGNRFVGNPSHNHNNNGGGRPRNQSNPPPQNNASNAPSGSSDVNVSVNSNSRVTKVNSNTGTNAGKPNSNATNNGKYMGNASGVDSRTTSSKSERRATDTASRDKNNPSENRQRSDSGSRNVGVQNRQANAAAKNVITVPAVKGSTTHTADKKNSMQHDRSDSHSGRETNNTSRQNTQTHGRFTPSSRDAAKTGSVPTKPAVSSKQVDAVVNGGIGGVNVQSSASVDAPTSRISPNNVNALVISHSQSTSRVSGAEGIIDRQGANTDVGIENNNSSAYGTQHERNTTVSNGMGTVRQHNTRTYDTRSMSGTYSHSSSVSNSKTSERRVNHEYKFGRYNPAAANRKGTKTYYSKDTKATRQQREYKRGENSGEAAKKHRSEGSPRRTDSRRNS